MLRLTSKKNSCGSNAPRLDRRLHNNEVAMDNEKLKPNSDFPHVCAVARGLEPDIETDFSAKLDYSGYLHLAELLSAQKPLSEPMQHDEILFIIQHQTSELWMKLLIHELQAAIRFIQKDSLESCFKILARVKQVQRMLFEQWAVLETLTPSEYMKFRGIFGHASGFQSVQYRQLEFLFGNKDAATLKVYDHDPASLQVLKNTLESPSIYDEFLRCMARNGFKIPTDRIERNWSLPYEPSEEVVRAFAEVYNNPLLHWREYEMCEKLVDVDEAFALWRFRHMKTVERIIGFRKGTGGSSGVSFLKQVVDIHLFPELWQVRTLIS